VVICRFLRFAFFTVAFCFALTLSPFAQTYTDLHDFNPSAGNLLYPAQLAQGVDGNFYGTLPFAGPAGFGQVFQVTPSGVAAVLFSFDSSNGSDPESGLTLGTDGNFYGSTFGGGKFGSGTAFKITASGALTTLHNFTGDVSKDGANPYCFPVEGVDGNFYGTTESGTAYTISTSGQFHLLNSSLPGHTIGPLLLSRNGIFYGVTLNGGTYDDGTIFRMTRAGAVTILYSFVDGVTGSNPYGPLVEGPDGSLYGTTTAGAQFLGGTIFKLSPGHGSAVSVVYYFAQNATGFDAIAGPVFGTDGNLYGATIAGGTSSVGVLFRSSAAGSYDVLYDMDGAHGANPASTQIQGTNGKFYGLTNPGGLYNGGVFYSLDAGLGPFVALVNGLGKVGTNVVILGQGLRGTKAVSFHGMGASFKVHSNNSLIAQVPAGATTGLVKVRTPSGTLKSNRPFRVLP
jgi:uncharacterized repeat protein (TIGR03803 family)